MRSYWVPGVNQLGQHGRLAFDQIIEVYEIERAFGELIDGFASPMLG